MLEEFDNGNNSILWLIYDMKDIEYRILKISRFYNVN
jgi:hypothetical protein